MARPSFALVAALRRTAARLEAGSPYRWSHFAHCNCGNLVQSVTSLSPHQIYQAAFARAGDWGEQAREFCPTSGYPIDFMLDRLFELGMNSDDVRHLERLSDGRVLARMGVKALRHNVREDVVAYMRAWADLLDEASPPCEFAQAAE